MIFGTLQEKGQDKSLTLKHSSENFSMTQSESDRYKDAH